MTASPTQAGGKGKSMFADPSREEDVAGLDSQLFQVCATLLTPVELKNFLQEIIKRINPVFF